MLPQQIYLRIDERSKKLCGYCESTEFPKSLEQKQIQNLPSVYYLLWKTPCLYAYVQEIIIKYESINCRCIQAYKTIREEYFEDPKRE